MDDGRLNQCEQPLMYAFIVSTLISHGIFICRWNLLKIDDIEDEDDEITTQQSKMLDDALSFLEQCEEHDPK